jgi:hypothetical protein
LDIPEKRVDIENWARAEEGQLAASSEPSSSFPSLNGFCFALHRTSKYQSLPISTRETPLHSELFEDYFR